MDRNLATIHVSASATAQLTYHCPHPGGSASFRLPDSGGQTIVYVTGTPDELADAGLALIQAAADLRRRNQGKKES